MKSEALGSFSTSGSTSGEASSAANSTAAMGAPKENGKRATAAMVRVMRAGSEDIVVGENSSLEGSFETQGSMFVDGSLTKADLRTTLLSIGTAGSVEGNATVGRAEIAGDFDGRLEVEGEVILRSTSHVVGEIVCGKLISHRGACIRAHVTVTEDESETAEATEHVRIAKLTSWRIRLRGGLWRRLTSFGYGVFFSLGTLGILSLVLK